MNDVVSTRYWTALDGGRVRCDLCPRYCELAEGQRGLCFVRMNSGGAVVLTTWGRSSGFCVDPIEKKPLNHFHPGSAVLSFGTAGCNLTCRFCQNWDISRSRQMDRIADEATPEQIASMAVREGCRSVAYTYNDPVIFHEFAIDTAVACEEACVQSVAVTAGYVCDAPRQEFYRHMHAANVDLKSFSDDFYRRLCSARLDPVLDTLRYLAIETDVWLEITTLLIPGENDGDDELHAMSQWIAETLGVHVPLHFTAFHPDWKMTALPPTSLATLRRARSIARGHGLRYVYTGNVSDTDGATTSCHHCGAPVIVRDRYAIRSWALDASGRCEACGTTCDGVFDAAPGEWGGRRRPL